MPGEVKRRPRYPTFKFPTMMQTADKQGRAPGMEERLKTSVWSPPPTSPSKLDERLWTM